MLAVSYNHPDVVSVLIRNGARLDLSPFSDGRTLLTFAAGKGHLAIMRILLAQPEVDVNAPCPAGGPLIAAASKNRVDVVAYLLEAGANCNRCRPRDNRTALIVASAAGHADVVRLLVSQDGIDFTHKEHASGHTALMIAVACSRIDVIDKLLAASAARSQYDANTQDAFQLALIQQDVRVIEVFIRYGHIPPDADLDLDNLENIDDATVIADLSASRLLSGLLLPADETAASYLRQLFDTSSHGQDTRSALRWLRKEGMSMACARQVAAALGRLPEIIGGHGANTRLRELYCLSALRCLTAPDTEWRLLAPYRAAGISVAALQQLETRAIWQLNEIARFATLALEQVTAQMTDWVINICMDKTGLDGLVRNDSLNAKLCKNGFLKPFAEAISASWQVALTDVLEECPAAMPPNAPVKIAMVRTHAHMIQRAPRLLARDLLRRLDAGETLARLRAMPGDSVHQILQTLFQFQFEQLRQTCLDSIGDHAPGEAPASQQ